MSAFPPSTSALQSGVPHTEATVQAHGVTTPRAGQRRRRWPMFMGICLLLLMVVVVVAPRIVAQTALRQQVLPILFPNIAGTMTIEASELDWWAPVRATGAVALDPQGREVLRINQITSTRSLWEIALQPQQLGLFRLQGVTISTTLTPAGSTLEDVLRPYLASPSSGLKPAVQVIVDGQLRITDQSQTTWDLTLKTVDVDYRSANDFSVRAEVANPAEPDRLLVMNYAIPSQTAGSVAGTIEGNTSTPARAQNETVPPALTTDELTPISEGKPVWAVAQELQIDTDEWSVEALTGIARRFAPNLTLAGQLTSHGTLRVGGEPAVQGDWSGVLSTRNGKLAGWQAGNNDQLQWASASCEGAVRWTSEQLTLAGLAIESDFGTAKLQGDIPRSIVSSTSAEAWWNNVLRQRPYRMSGSLLLGAIARQLPDTLRLREGVQIVDGRADFSIQSSVQGVTQAWDVSARFNNLTALVSGVEEVWPEPFDLKSRIEHNGTQWELANLKCQSEFLTATGAGNWSQGDLQARFDLARLALRLSRLLDFPADSLQGMAALQLQARRADDREWKLSGLLTLQRFVLSLGANQRWEEPELTVQLAATGELNSSAQVQQWSAVEGAVTSGGDVLSVALTNPLPWAAGMILQDQTIPGHMNLTGDLTRWKNRLEPWTGPWNLGVAGNVAGEGDVVYSADSFALRNTRLRLRSFALGGPGWSFAEPDAQCELTATWLTGRSTRNAPEITQTSNFEPAPRQEPDASGSTHLQVKTAKWIGTQLAAKLDQGELHLAGGALTELSGVLQVRGEVGQLAGLMGLTPAAGAPPIQGQLAASAQVQRRGNRLDAQGTWSVDRFQVPGTQGPEAGGAAVAPVWSEDRLEGTLAAGLDQATGLLELSKLTAVGQGWQAQVAGTISDLLTTAKLNLSGELGYDWAELSPRITTLAGTPVVLSGTDRRPFTLQGALRLSVPQLDTGAQTALQAVPVAWPLELKGQAELGWVSLQVSGLSVGPTDLLLQLDQGKLRLAPLDIPVGTGRVKLNAEAMLACDPQYVYLQPGPIVEQVALTPELCRAWIKYLAPLVADATAAEGAFSVGINHTYIPLNAPRTSDIAGELQIDNGQIGPGPMLTQLFGTVEQLRSIVGRQAAEVALDRSWVVLPEQTTKFRLLKERVYHQSLLFDLGHVRLTTGGSVGFDETLALQVGIPFQADWFDRPQVAEMFQGRTVPVNVGGTLSRPQIDPSSLADVGRQLATGALENLVEDKLQGGLEQLLRRRKK